MPAKSLNCGSWERAGIDMLNGPSAACADGEGSPPVNNRQANRARKKRGVERLSDIARLRENSLLFLYALSARYGASRSERGESRVAAENSTDPAVQARFFAESGPR